MAPYRFLKIFLIIHTIKNIHTITSPNIIMNAAPPTLTEITTITVNITAINSNNINNNIVTINSFP